MSTLPVAALAAVFVAGGLALGGCASGAPGSPPTPVASGGTGGLEVRIKDHEEAIERFRSLEVKIASVAIHPTALEREVGWRDLQTAATTIELTELVGGPYAVVFNGEVESGEYDGIRLSIDQIHGLLQNGSEAVVEPGEFEAFLNFDLSAGQETIALLDMVVLDVSEHGTEGYLLTLIGASLVWE
ncbi:MAG: DUF4382 domain-containing protein [Anaerolineae bacterium]